MTVLPASSYQPQAPFGQSDFDFDTRGEGMLRDYQGQGGFWIEWIMRIAGTAGTTATLVRLAY